MKTWKLTFTAKVALVALVIASAGMLMFGVGSADANPYGTNITKYDGVGLATNGGSAPIYEDNETEPGMVRSQAWDLEGFLLKGRALTIVGGYNFYAGQEGMQAGDIFIDTNGDAIYSPNTIPSFNYNPGYKEVSNGLFKYDYVLDINWTDGKFNIVQLNEQSILIDTEYGAQYNKPSNPWIYKFASGDTVINSGSFNTYDKLSRTDTGFLGMGGNNKHFVATFDISAIPNTAFGTDAIFHNTMECGNDNLIGQAALVPEPTTMLLLGAGLLGIGLVRRRIRK